MGFFDERRQAARLKALTDEQTARIRGASVVAGNHAQSAVDIALKSDVDKIRAMPSIKQREIYKREHFLPKWLPYVEDYIDKGENYENPTLAYCMVYSYDIADFTTAQRLTEVMIAQGQLLPASFKSTPAAFSASFILEWSEKEIRRGESCEPYFSDMLKKVLDEWDLHEIIKAKWLKYCAQLLLRTANGKVYPAGIFEGSRLTAARALLYYALYLNHKAGVQSLIHRIDMRLNALEQAGLYRMSQQERNTSPGGRLISESLGVKYALIVDLLRRPPLSESEIRAKLNNTNKARAEHV